MKDTFPLLVCDARPPEAGGTQLLKFYVSRGGWQWGDNKIGNTPHTVERKDSQRCKAHPAPVSL